MNRSLIPSVIRVIKIAIVHGVRLITVTIIMIRMEALRMVVMGSVSGLSWSIISMCLRIVVVLIVVVIGVVSTIRSIIRSLTYVIIVSVRTAIGSVRAMSLFSSISRWVRTRPMSPACPTRRTMVGEVSLSRHEFWRWEVVSHLLFS